jgi:hypothetical protein
MELLTVQQPSHPEVGSGGSALPAEVLGLLVAAILVAAVWAMYIQLRDTHDGGARRLVSEVERWLRHY